ncbi:MAG: hypothetical protein A3G34_08095 [Candidatus Lindowbacteria bacterium RIFCSPLOWO2_12_FULL_62_27]|nr:MAG: hypothetical protein A3G34_08095 [Candidatus Lindowbacteria bacterium RIFCSPLOWO2_12_FULL_62_27]OGH62344.1 MAG: hypothetical protein A3I06_00330 [Candidatus Lindowbacteria bacterium RIFCSPLOWO2_02_FULL_62_12]
MTQYYALPKFSLNRSRPSIKVLITLFLIGTLLATWLSVYTLHHRTGLTVRGVVQYYLGNEGVVGAAEILFPKSSGEMLEFFHIHAFTLLLLMFILCHFVALTTVSEARKIMNFTLTFLSWLGMMVFPWGVRFGASPSRWAGAALCSGFVFLAVTAVGSAAVLWEVWISPLGDAKALGDPEDGPDL